MTPSRMLQQKKKRKIFLQSHWIMTFDLKIQFQIDICVFMKSHSHILCVLTPVHTGWILCIHEKSQPHFLCSYTCPYRMDLLPPTSEDAPASYYKMMDLSDISDFQDVMTTTSHEDIPALEDIFRLWIWTMVWINIYTPCHYTPWPLSKWTSAELSKHDVIHL